MKSLLNRYYRNPFAGIAALFTGIPFWVPLAAIFFTNADVFTMLITAALCFGARAYAKAFLTHKNPFASVSAAFILSPFAFIGKVILFFVITGFLLAFASAGNHFDSSLAAIGIILVFNFIFIKSATGFNLVNTLLFFLSIPLWILYLTGQGAAFAVLGYLAAIILFHRRFGLGK